MVKSKIPAGNRKKVILLIKLFECGYDLESNWRKPMRTLKKELKKIKTEIATSQNPKSKVAKKTSSNFPPKVPKLHPRVIHPERYWKIKKLCPHVYMSYYSLEKILLELKIILSNSRNKSNIIYDYLNMLRFIGNAEGIDFDKKIELLLKNSKSKKKQKHVPKSKCKSSGPLRGKQNKKCKKKRKQTIRTNMRRNGSYATVRPREGHDFTVSSFSFKNFLNPIMRGNDFHKIIIVKNPNLQEDGNISSNSPLLWSMMNNGDNTLSSVENRVEKQVFKKPKEEDLSDLLKTIQ